MVKRMAEYIDRKAVLSILAAKNAPWNAYEKIAALPAADVQPVKHGRWILENNLSYSCSVCGVPQWNISMFCPDCGAKMDGEA